MVDVKQVRFLLIGAGNVGRRFLGLVARKEQVLRERAGLQLVLAGVADSSGIAANPEGLDLEWILALKAGGRGVAEIPDWGQPGVAALDMVRGVPVELLVDASPANMLDGQPGLGCIELALSQGTDVVTANKAPLALAFPRLDELARAHGARLRFDATVAGGLPAVNLGRRDLAVADVHRIEGILNLTTNYILTRMAAEGLGFEEALSKAQQEGHAESDPSLDLEGWDAANKLIILAHSVLRYPASLDELEIEGIGGVTPRALREAAANGQQIKPLAVAEREDQGYRLWVRPVALDAAHPLASLGPQQMGIVYHTDISGVITAAIVEDTPQPTASAVLRDVVELYGRATGGHREQ
jgi:homoserine dehydrogenase